MWGGPPGSGGPPEVFVGVSSSNQPGVPAEPFVVGTFAIDTPYALMIAFGG
jgi:hypothetical protein